MKKTHELKSLSRDLIVDDLSVLMISYLIFITIPFFISKTIYLGSLSTVFIALLLIGLYNQAFNVSLNRVIGIEDMFVDIKIIGKIIMTKLIIWVFELPSFIITLPMILYSLASLSTNPYLSITILILVLIWVYILQLFLSQVNFIIMDNENIDIIEAVKYSIKLTQKNMIRIIKLDISFIPLFIVSILLKGIPFMLIIPYYLVSKSQLYLDIKENN